MSLEELKAELLKVDNAIFDLELTDCVYTSRYTELRNKRRDLLDQIREEEKK